MSLTLLHLAHLLIHTHTHTPSGQVSEGLIIFLPGGEAEPCPLSPTQVMLVGDSGVGKTCLLVRFKDAAFLAGSFISTVGIDFRVCSLIFSS